MKPLPCPTIERTPVPVPTSILHRGKALAVLRELPDASVDALVTDPPYSSGGAFRGDRANKSSAEKYTRGDYAGALRESFTGDNRDQRAYAYWCALWLSECLRVTREGGLALIFTDWRQLPTTTDALQSGGWVWRGIIPWHKTNARNFAGRYTNACEYVVWGSKGALPNPLHGGRSYPGIYTASAPRVRDHAAQKPLEVMRGLLTPVRAGGTVLDPFAGTGTTGVAAIESGLDFVGAEMSEHYHRVALKRLAGAEPLAPAA